jgi:hypothetical protein
MSLSVNDRGHLGYPAADTLKEDGTMSVPQVAGQ